MTSSEEPGLDIIAIVSFIGTRLAAGTLFVGVPLALAGIAHYGLRHVAEPDYVQIPLLIKLTVTAGLILGVGLVAGVARPDYYLLDQIVRVDGPWDLSLGEFLSHRVNPLALDIPAIVDAIRFDDPKGNLAVLFGAPALLALAMIAACYLYWPPVPATICALVSLGAIVIVAYVVFYMVCGTLWLVNLLNFWVLLVILALFQWRKHAL